MRIVTLTRDMRPWHKGQDAVLPDALAAKLIKAGEATNEREYPPREKDSQDTHLEPKRYLTRKRG
jgi:hypothetical protein